MRQASLFRPCDSPVGAATGREAGSRYGVSRSRFPFSSSLFSAAPPHSCLYSTPLFLSNLYSPPLCPRPQSGCVQAPTLPLPPLPPCQAPRCRR